MLLLGNAQDLKELAIRDVTGAGNASGKVILGDGWWQLAEKEDAAYQPMLRDRASYWYEQAFSGLSGLTRDRIEKRLRELHQDPQRMVAERQAAEWVLEKGDDLKVEIGNQMQRVKSRTALPRRAFVVREVLLSDKGITDADLVRLKPFAGLRTLTILWNTNITDLGLRHLECFDELENLCLWDAKITDEGMKSVARLPHLISLRISDTRVTDRGLRELLGMQELRTLALDGNQITDQGLEALGLLDNLESLNLISTQVSDKGMAYLRSLKHLSTLFLGNTQTSDKGLDHLKQLPSLKWLDLTGTRVSSRGIAMLKQSLPNCYIDFDTK